MLSIKLFNVLFVQSEIYLSCTLCGLVDNQAFCHSSRSDAILVMINSIFTKHRFHAIPPPLPPSLSQPYLFHGRGVGEEQQRRLLPPDDTGLVPILISKPLGAKATTQRLRSGPLTATGPKERCQGSVCCPQEAGRRCRFDDMAHPRGRMQMLRLNGAIPCS